MKTENTTALVGLSGAGKSTVINLLCKFYLPDSGEILLDGVNLNEYENTFLRSDLGLVLPEKSYLSGSIEDNIRYGDMNAGFEKNSGGCKKLICTIRSWIFLKKYQHDATQLSGGQQQRIAIARLFLKIHRLFFWMNQQLVWMPLLQNRSKNSLDAIKEGRTVIIISHSLSQILDSDTIYVMKKGRVVENGTHDELYNKEGTYREIFDASARSLNLDKLVNTFKEN